MLGLRGLELRRDIFSFRRCARTNQQQRHHQHTDPDSHWVNLLIHANSSVVPRRSFFVSRGFSRIGSSHRRGVHTFPQHPDRIFQLLPVQEIPNRIPQRLFHVVLHVLLDVFLQHRRLGDRSTCCLHFERLSTLRILHQHRLWIPGTVDYIANPELRWVRKLLCRHRFSQVRANRVFRFWFGILSRCCSVEK